MTRLSWILTIAVLGSMVGAGAADMPALDSPVECSRAKTATLSKTAAAKHIDDPSHYLTDVRHYVIDFEVDPEAEIIDGSTTMTVASRVEDLTMFRFWLNESMVISSVEVDGRDAVWNRLNSTMVDVTLDRGYDAGEIFDLAVSYRGRPIPNWFFSTQGSSPVVSTLSQPWHAMDWWAVKNDNTDKATGELLVTVPSELTVVSNGVLVGNDIVGGGKRRFHWSTEYPTTPYLFAFSTTVYNRFSETYFFDGGSMPVEFFIYPDSDTPENRDGWRLTLPMLEIFEELYGPYPFRDEKYAIYQFPFGGGMEHQTATGQGGNSAFRDYLTSHEVAHQWWGDLVTCADWHHIWLNEGFATYSTALWYEFASGVSNPENRRIYMDIRRPSSLDGSVYVYDASDQARIFSSNYSYSKGAWVVHMLRGVVGDENFFDILATYRQRFAYSTADTEDFRRVAEEIWGDSLEWFFDEWIYGGGAPGYRSAWTEHVVNGQRYVEIIIQQSQSGDVFTMPIEVDIEFAGQQMTHRVWSDDRLEHHLIPVSGEVDDVTLDPGEWILTRFISLRPFADGPPKIVAINPPPDSIVPSGQPLTMAITFHRDVVVEAGDFVLRGHSGRELGFDLEYDPATYTATLTSSGPIPGGHIWVNVSDDIVDAEDGIALDGELDQVRTDLLPSGDGVPGGDAIIDLGAIGMRRLIRQVLPLP